MMSELTANVDVPYFETMAFSMSGMAYSQYIRPIVIEKINDPKHIWDDRVLAMMDGLFGYKEG